MGKCGCGGFCQHVHRSGCRVLAAVAIRDGHRIVTAFRDGNTLVGGFVPPQVGVSCSGGKRRAGAFTEGGVAIDGHCRKGVDGQVESVHLIASIGILMRVGVCAALGVSFTVAIRPCVGFATGDTIDLVCRFVDGEVQRDHRVATCSIGSGVRRRVVTFSIGGAVPLIAFAGSHGFGTCGAMVDGKVQRHHGIAACRIGGGPSRGVGACSIGVAVPHVAVAGGHLLDACSAVVDGEVQRHHRVAIRRVGGGPSRGVGACSIGCAVPHVAVAGGHLIDACSAVIDGKVQRHHRVATCSIGGGPSRGVGACSIGVAVPLIAFASGHGFGARGRHVHRDGEGLYGRGGTGDFIGGQSGRGRHAVVGGCCRINRNGCTGLIVPSIGHITVVAIDRCGEFRAFPLADGLVTADSYGASIRLEDGQVQRHHTVHAALGRICFRVVAGGVVGHTIPCVRVASSRRNVVGYGGCYREVQGDGGVAAVGGSGGKGHSIVTGFLVRGAVPLVAVDGIDGDIFFNRFG